MLTDPSFLRCCHIYRTLRHNVLTYYPSDTTSQTPRQGRLLTIRGDKKYVVVLKRKRKSQVKEHRQEIKRSCKAHNRYEKLPVRGGERKPAKIGV